MLVINGLQKHQVVITDNDNEQVIISVYQLPGLIRKLALYLEKTFEIKEVSSG